jgi:hypothetical protein
VKSGILPTQEYDGGPQVDIVPEPALIFPVAVILGCGALVFNSRRRMKKQAA